jgi:hypothetical protein
MARGGHGFCDAAEVLHLKTPMPNGARPHSAATLKAQSRYL